MLRRTGRGGALLRAWDVTVDTVARSATKAGVPVALTPREFDLLEQLLRNRGAALYRDVLFERVWGGEMDDGTRTLDLHIQRLRKKLGWQEHIKTVYKVGVSSGNGGRAVKKKKSAPAPADGRAGGGKRRGPPGRRRRKDAPCTGLCPEADAGHASGAGHGALAGGAVVLAGNFDDALNEAGQQAEVQHLLQCYALESDLLDVAARGETVTDSHLARYGSSLEDYVGGAGGPVPR